MRATSLALGGGAVLAGSITTAAVVATPSAAATGGMTLEAGQYLHAGEQLVAGPNVLVMQGDGNLVIYASGSALWSSNTYNNPGAFAVMQSDGNLVVYGLGRALFATGTNGRGGQRVVMQGDGNVVVYTASGGALWHANTYTRAYARNRLGLYGWGGDQWGCLDALWYKESRWNELARNRTSWAYGIPQALPGYKMAVAGADWRTNPFTQIRWGQDYIKARYAKPCGAWSHSLRNSWY